MKRMETATKALDILEKGYPDARVTLNFKDPLQLLIATILAAQCTDERVNEVTRDLFKKYHNKAKSVIACGQMIGKKFKGQVPRTLEELISLPGVGRKTANIILGNAYGQQAIAVDTHVKRVTHRLGWAESDNPDKIEFELMEVIPRNRWTMTCHQLVFLGRRICIAKKPKCSICPVTNLCPKIGVTQKE